MSSRRETETGGREATTRHIMGDVALSVGAPEKLAPAGWKWAPLTSVARLESGHTPSRSHPEYWGGDVPWIGIKDAKAHHGSSIFQTLENTNELGIANSSSRVLPAGTVCLSRTASVGYVTIMGQPMATSQDFANWVCSDAIVPQYLAYLFLAEEGALHRFASGAVHSTIYYPELKAFHVAMPPVGRQKQIVALLDEVFEGLRRAQSNAEENHKAGRQLFQAASDQLCSSSGNDWIVGTVSELIGTVSTGPFGSLLHKADYVEGQTPVINPANIEDGEIVPDRSKTIGSEKLEELHAYTLNAGDIVIGRRGEMGRCAVVRPEAHGWVCGTGSFVIRTKGDVLPDFAAHVLRSPTFVRRLEAIATGATMPNLNNAAMGALPIALPNLQTQRQLCERIDELSRHVEATRRLYSGIAAEIDELRRSLLIEAFSGKLS